MHVDSTEINKSLICKNAYDFAKTLQIMTFLFNFASESYLELVLPQLSAVLQIPLWDLLGKGAEEFVR